MIIRGDNGVSLRLVEESDAGFTLGLRSDPELNRHLSKTSGSLESQKNFISQYKQKEKNGEEYYFIIEFKNNPVGTVRLYNVDHKNSESTWGSWIIKRGNPGDVALSSAYLSYYFAFNHLNLHRLNIDVRKENVAVAEFYKIYCNFLYEDDLNYYLDLKKENLVILRNRFKGRIPNEISLAE